MEYKNITDCWLALYDCADLEEMQATIKDFPIWSEMWDIKILNKDTVRVTNSYFNEQYGDTQSEQEDFDTILTKESIFDLMDDAVEIDLSETGCATNVIIHNADKERLKYLVSQALDLYSENNAEKSAAEYFMDLTEDSNMFIYYDI